MKIFIAGLIVGFVFGINYDWIKSELIYFWEMRKRLIKKEKTPNK